MPLEPDEIDKLLAQHFNRVRGVLSSMVESWGLPHIRERGCITTLKELTYAAQKELRQAIKEASNG